MNLPSMPDFTNPIVLWGACLSLARAACFTFGYILYQHGAIDQRIELEIEGASVAVAAVLWMLYKNHSDAQKLAESVKTTLEAVAVQAVIKNETVKESVHAVAAQKDVVPTPKTIQAISIQENQQPL